MAGDSGHLASESGCYLRRVGSSGYMTPFQFLFHLWWARLLQYWHSFIFFLVLCNYIKDLWDFRLQRHTNVQLWSCISLIGYLSCAENKFAVGSGAKTVCVCYFEEDNNWYLISPVFVEIFSFWNAGCVWLCASPSWCMCVFFPMHQTCSFDPLDLLFILDCLWVLGLSVSSYRARQALLGRLDIHTGFLRLLKWIVFPCRWVSKLIRKKHHSTITSVAWHPNNVSIPTIFCLSFAFVIYLHRHTPLNVL